MFVTQLSRVKPFAKPIALVCGGLYAWFTANEVMRNQEFIFSILAKNDNMLFLLGYTYLKTTHFVSYFVRSSVDTC